MRNSTLIIIFLISFSPLRVFTQCFMPVPACGYSISINYHIISVNLGSGYPPCPYGYSYTVTYDYEITVSGQNTCYNQNIDILPNVLCGSISSWPPANIVIPGPTFGAPPTTSVYTGLITTGAQWNVLTNCATATPTSLNCRTTEAYFGAPGIPWSKYVCKPYPLPVDIISFSGECTNEGIELKWSTLSEVNNDYFSLEVLTEENDYKVVAVIDGAENSSQKEDYIFTHIDYKSNLPYLFYRLKQTDFNGDFKYCDLIAVKNCENELNVHPNPSNGIINLVLSENVERIHEVEVYNYLNQKIFYSKEYCSSIDLSNEAKGVYFLKFIVDEKVKMIKFIIN